MDNSLDGDSKTDSVASAASDLQTLIVENSSTIKQISYSDRFAELFIAFKGGGCYSYEGVSKEAWDKFTSAESKGKHFGAEIKPRYTGRKL